jgi:pimeloyl-ACP methyl ester carboxylesterase
MTSPITKTTAGGTRYAMYPAQAGGPAPLLVSLGTAAHANLTHLDFSRQGLLLREKGWNVVSVDPPCHGEDLRSGERAEILGWVDRFAKGEDTVAAFVARTNDVIDELVRDGVARPGAIAVMGISRGGFLAFHVAAGNARIGAVCTLAPVADWSVLREFAGMTENALVKGTAVMNIADTITCPVWTIIGSSDDRVDTGKTVEVMQRLLANNTKRETKLAIDLHLTSTPGHLSLAWWHDEGARWLTERVKM